MANKRNWRYIVNSVAFQLRIEHGLYNRKNLFMDGWRVYLKKMKNKHASAAQVETWDPRKRNLYGVWKNENEK